MPIGSLDGSFALRDIGADGIPFTLFRGQLFGTIGFEPCQPPGAAESCCAYPRVAGMLLGRGRPGTPAAGCLTRWIFCGDGPKDPSDPAGPCRLLGWDVQIVGVVKCPCG